MLKYHWSLMLSIPDNFYIPFLFFEGGCTRGYLSQRAGVVRTEPSRFSTRVRANANMGRFHTTQSLAEHGWQQSADCHGKTLVYSARYNSVYLMHHCFVFSLLVEYFRRFSGVTRFCVTSSVFSSHFSNCKASALTGVYLAFPLLTIISV